MQSIHNRSVSEGYVKGISALLKKREDARNDLLSFVKFINPKYQVADHHFKIAEALMKAATGEIKRLMIFMPPGHGKSELASRAFPAWLLGRNKNFRIISATNSQDNAYLFSRNVKDIVESDEYKLLFKDRINPTNRAVGSWSTLNGNMYRAAGVGTAIQGLRANLFIIDDAIADHQSADSLTNRDNIYRWQQTTVESRMAGAPELAVVVIINTRWHEDDLCGRLLANDPTMWHVISFPAISEDNEPLWGERFSLEFLQWRKKNMPMRDWNALYQQNPIPDDGDFFKAEWFKTLDNPVHLDSLRIYGSSDYAVTDNGGDYTVHGICGVDRNNNIHLLDFWSGQKSPDVWIEKQCDLILQYKPLCWFGESGVIRKSIEPFLKRRMQERQSYCRIEWLSSITDKVSRARAIQGMASMGKVFLPQNGSWLSSFKDQLLRFPNAKHDDYVDVVSLFGRGLQVIGMTNNVIDVPLFRNKYDITPNSLKWMA